MSAARRGERNARFNSTALGCLPPGHLPVALSGLQVIAKALYGLSAIIVLDSRSMSR
jgi:hypothetical protein